MNDLDEIANDVNIQADYDSGIWVKTPYFSGALVNMFHAVWNQIESEVKIKQ